VVRHRTSPRQPSPAVVKVPFHTSPLSRGALRSAGVPTIAASTTPAPLLPWRSRRAPRGIWEDSVQAQGNTPCAPRGGLCGCLAVRQTFSKPPGVPTGWGRPQGRTSRSGLLLGRLGGVFGAHLAPRSRLPTALWGIQEGKADVTRGESGAQPDEQRGHAGPSARRPCDLVTLPP
jgi:hypothetical protein